jgi:8-oxo-dGTP diphosphatase
MILQVGVKALIQNNKAEFLLIRRAVAFGEETEPHWDIPGGRIDPEEPLIEALAREVQEETGLSISSMPNLIAAQDIFAKHAELHVVRLTYLLQGEGTPTLSDEHQESKWMSIDEALEARLDPYTREVIETKIKNA